jgi:hypothetical protein
MTKIEYLDRPPSGWFPLDVMRATPRKWDWCALMVDVDPDDLKHCVVEFPALFYVHPDNYRPGEREAQQRFVRIPGKHRSKDAAWTALENMVAKRHHRREAKKMARQPHRS